MAKLKKPKMQKVKTIKIKNRVADIYAGVREAQAQPASIPGGVPQEQAQAAQQQPGAMGMGQPLYPVQTLPLQNVVDRKYEIRQMMKNFDKVSVLCKEKNAMLEKLLRSNGKDTKGFLDDPALWDDKAWHEVVRKTERLVRDINQILMTTREESGAEPELKEEPMPRRPDESHIYMRNKPGGGASRQKFMDWGLTPEYMTGGR